MRLSCFVLAALAVLPPAAGFAQGAAPSSEVHIYVSLSDSATRYYPVPAHRMIIYRTPRDSTIAMTDSSGSTTVHLPPGQYRLVSAKPVGWHGYDYSWNVPILVRGATTIIDLRAPDAVTGVVAAHGADLSRQSAASTLSDTTPITLPVPPRIPDPGATRKDPTLAFLLSFLVTGAGDVYAHAYGNAVLSWATAITGAVILVNAQNAQSVCFGSGYSRSCTTEPDPDKAALGASMIFASWVTSMIDAPIAARKYNRDHGFDPVVGLDRRRGALVGLAYRF